MEETKYEKLLAEVREVLKSIRFAQGIAEDERWSERASGYKQAADWLEEAIGK